MDQSTTRFVIFIIVLAVMASAEWVFPKRERQLSRPSRWFTNLSLTVINIIVLRLLGPITALAASNYALENGWGLLSYSPVPLHFFFEMVLGIMLLDCAIYCQHVASHKVPLLWRFHKVHHADRDIDVTTGIRFHPFEALLSMAYKCIVILLIGPIAAAVIVFEIILNASAMFNHANLSLSKETDSALRKLIVTPDMHRVHHSIIQDETDSNYGFFLSIWDRIFRTYNAQPIKGHTEMTIGLAEYQDEKPGTLLWSITIPFRKVRGSNSSNT
jgi:sterol desaturase/sphingolipid hydroxylase (fatty acid hydroxylase superfamily)